MRTPYYSPQAYRPMFRKIRKKVTVPPSPSLA